MSEFESYSLKSFKKTEKYFYIKYNSRDSIEASKIIHLRKIPRNRISYLRFTDKFSKHVNARVNTSKFSKKAIKDIKKFSKFVNGGSLINTLLYGSKRKNRNENIRNNK